MSDVQRFTLTDRKGKDHEYALVLHAGTEGASVALRIMGMLSGPAAQGLVALVGSEGLLDRIASEGLDGVDTSELTEALKDLDGTELAKALSGALTDPGTEGLITRDLMKHLSRDGKALRASREFDVAYQGNYGELLRAAMEVVRANAFLPWSPT